MKRIVVGISLIFCTLCGSITVFAVNPPEKDLSGILQSKAYQQFTRRPLSDRSKLLYLIEHFQAQDIEVYYDGYYYKAPFAAGIAKYFLMNFYKNQTVPVWILKWCNVSIGGHLIYVKYPDGSFRLSRDVLIDQWKLLESAIAASSTQPSSL